MGVRDRIGERLAERERRPADPILLDPTRTRGSEGMVESADPAATARTVRRRRDGRRWRWFGLSR